jgi:calcineurin-like phosphoesterase family protein
MDYLVSDLRLDHVNITDYRDRPFSSVEEMKPTLVEH